MNAIRRGVTYTPPAQEEIRAFVQTACKKMGTQIDGTFDTPQIRTELTAFLTVVATIYAKQLTRQAHESLDNTPTGE